MSESASEYVLFNARVHTADSAMPGADALVVAGERVVFVGSARDALQSYPFVRRLDANGLTILPGFIDAHAHVVGLGERLLQADLRGADSPAEVVRRLQSAGPGAERGKWLLGTGWDQTCWSRPVFPERALLDAAFPDRPVWLLRVDGHVGWANAAALREAGVGAETAEPAGGRLLRNERGEPTGIFVDAAMPLIENAIPAPDESDRQRAIDAAIAAFHARGVTGVHDAATTCEMLASFRARAGAGRLDLRLATMIDGRKPGFDAIYAEEPVQAYRDRLWVRAVKFFMDGALGSHGAALLEGYADEPDNHGLLLYEPEAFRAEVRRATDRGYQVCTHAIGDRAVRAVLEAYEHGMTPAERTVLRPRLEHAQILHPDDVPRIGTLGIIASMQPAHAVSDLRWVADRLGRERLRHAYAWRSIRKHGARLAFGSDAPIEEPDPLAGMHAAMTRRRSDLPVPEGWVCSEALTAIEALRAQTADAAYAGFQEELTGTLSRGKYADFVVLDADLTRIPHAEIADVEVVATFFGGRCVWGGW